MINRDRYQFIITLCRQAPVKMLQLFVNGIVRLTAIITVHATAGNQASEDLQPLPGRLTICSVVSCCRPELWFM